MQKKCFVIMPIGEQKLAADVEISAAKLKSMYSDLIKEAVLKARPDVEVVRADEIAAPGGIATDIFMLLMHSDYVVADITYPNPNVFYELGIRHACRPGAISIREKNGPRPPFDVAALRHIEYENTSTGLKLLAEDMRGRFDWIDGHAGAPDNDFLKLAQLTSYAFPNFQKAETANDYFLEGIVKAMQQPELAALMQQGEGINQAELMGAIMKHPEVATTLLKAMQASGQLRLPPSRNYPAHGGRSKRKGR